jgi:hypothetical protein
MGVLFFFSAAFITRVMNRAMFSITGKRMRVSNLRAELLSALGSKHYETKGLNLRRRGEGVQMYLELEA